MLSFLNLWNGSVAGIKDSEFSESFSTFPENHTPKRSSINKKDLDVTQSLFGAKKLIYKPNPRPFIARDILIFNCQFSPTNQI